MAASPDVALVGDESKGHGHEQEYEASNEQPQEPGCRTVVSQSVLAKTRRFLPQLQRITSVGIAIASTYYAAARSNVFSPSASIPGDGARFEP